MCVGGMQVTRNAQGSEAVAEGEQAQAESEALAALSHAFSALVPEEEQGASLDFPTQG